MMARRLPNGRRARGSMDNQTDERDGSIIDMLRADPTVLNSRISEALGVSNATVGARIKKLKDLGIVRVVASTDIRTAGFNTVAIGSMAVAPGKARHLRCSRTRTRKGPAHHLHRHPAAPGTDHVLRDRSRCRSH